MRGSNHDWRRRLVRRRPFAPCTGRAGGRSPLAGATASPEAADPPDGSTAPENSPDAPPTAPRNAPVRLEATVVGTASGTAPLSFDPAGAADSVGTASLAAGCSSFAMGARSAARFSDGDRGETTSTASNANWTAGVRAGSSATTGLSGSDGTAAGSGAAGVGSSEAGGAATAGVAAAVVLAVLAAGGGGTHTAAPASFAPTGRTCMPLPAPSADSTTCETRTESNESAERTSS